VVGGCRLPAAGRFARELADLSDSVRSAGMHGSRGHVFDADVAALVIVPLEAAAGVAVQIFAGLQATGDSRVGN